MDVGLAPTVDKSTDDERTRCGGIGPSGMVLQGFWKRMWNSGLPRVVCWELEDRRLVARRGQRWWLA
jgi:hypothetical protein